jgi:hypothetical protein
MSSSGPSLPASPRREVALPGDRPLTVPLLVRGSFDNVRFGFLCLFLSLLALVAFCAGSSVLMGRAWEPAVLLWSLAALCGGLAALLGLWQFRRRQWLEVTLTGFVLSHRDQRRVYSDDQVAGVAQYSQTSIDGEVKHRVVLEVGTPEDAERIDCCYSVAVGKVDPLAGFLARLVQHVTQRTLAGLEQGAELRGSGWSFDRHGLRTGGTLYPIEAISWCGFFGERLCLWKGDDEGPFLRLSLSSRNAHSLGQVLWHIVRRRPDHDRPLPGLPLGRLLLERSSGALPLGLLLLVGGVVAGSYLAVLSESVTMPQPNILLVYSIVCFAIALGGSTMCWHGWRGGLRFHEFGVKQRGWSRTRRLMYQDIGTVIWKGDMMMTLRPAAGVPRPTISFRSVLCRLDGEVASMRDHLCRFLAAQWAAKIPHGPVPWTPRLRFLPGGLEYCPASLLGPNEPVSVPYELTSYRLEPHRFLLFVTGQTQPVLRENVSLPNFFVGLVVLNGIYQAALTTHDSQPAPRPPLPGAPDQRVQGSSQSSGGITPQRPDDG